MAFFDISVAAVPDDKKGEYETHCRDAGALFKREGALSVTDTWGADIADGKVTDFKRAVQAQDGETVCVGWITWPDKATRDKAWETLMADSAMRDLSMPFDGKRMIFGGFDGLVEG